MFPWGRQAVHVRRRAVAADGRSSRRLPVARPVGAPTRRPQAALFLAISKDCSASVAARAAARPFGTHPALGDRRTRSPMPACLAALTPAEAEVARLASGGAQNSQIARLRRVSTRTVANQMSSVLGKLGIVSLRVSLATLPELTHPRRAGARGPGRGPGQPAHRRLERPHADRARDPRASVERARAEGDRVRVRPEPVDGVARDARRTPAPRLRLLRRPGESLRRRLRGRAANPQRRHLRPRPRGGVL